MRPKTDESATVKSEDIWDFDAMFARILKTINRFETRTQGLTGMPILGINANRVKVIRYFVQNGLAESDGIYAKLTAKGKAELMNLPEVADRAELAQLEAEEKQIRDAERDEKRAEREMKQAERDEHRAEKLEEKKAKMLVRKEKALEKKEARAVKHAELVKKLEAARAEKVAKEATAQNH